MNRIVLTAVFFVFINLIQGQEKKNLVTIAFENSTRLDVLKQLEDIADVRFFYEEEWFANDETIRGNYHQVELSTLLDAIFNTTDLNYFILQNNQVVITQNRVIYGDLPEEFFGKSTAEKEIETVEEEVASPVLYGKQQSVKKSVIETVRIGKEDLRDKRSKFSLRGFVRAIKTGKPLSNVTVKLVNSPTGVVTDQKGQYKLNLNKGLNTLEVSSLGFSRVLKNLIIFNDGSLDFELSEEIEELDEVIVSSRRSTNVDEVEIGSNEVNSEESKNIPMVMGERNILKVATSLPGITTAGEGSAGFNVRGGKTDQNLILLDNAVLYNPTHFFGIFQALNPFTTKGIKIYKGSVPAKFGGRLSSVFEIESKDPSLDKIKGEASIGPVTNNIALELPLIKNKVGVILGGRSTYSDWILKSLDETSLKNSKATFYDLIAKVNAKIDSSNAIQATAYYSKDNFSITSDSIYGYDNVLFSLNWKRKLAEKHSANLSLSNSQYAFKVGYEADSNDNFRFHYGIDEIGAKLNFNYLYNDQHNFTYGGSIKKYSVQPGEIKPVGQRSAVTPVTLPNEQGLEAALYIADDFKVNDQLLVNVGLRYSNFQALGSATQRRYASGQPRNDETVINTLEFGKNETIKNYGGLETRISGRYFLGEDVSLKAGYNSMYQYIHTLSNTTTLSPIDTWKLSDYNIAPQRSQQIALGIFKNINLNEYEISLEGYYKKSKNVPDFKTGAQLLLNEYVETEILQGEGKSYGLEFLVRKNSGKLNGWLGYSYSRSMLKLDSQFDEERINNGNYFPSNYDKPHNVSLVANFKVTRRFSFSANFDYQTGRPVTYPIGNFNYQGDTYVIYSDRNKFRIPDYYRLDLSFNVEGNHKLKKLAHSFWNISVYNVLGRNNPYSVFFVTENGNVKAYKSSIFSIPIPSISYNLKF
ncbi:TonB-dependent receptor [Flavobacteriaceae bacterium F08102]|nr:TonB-dependent receptor [Flavobacteriaceae bacterium F08102]